MQSYLIRIALYTNMALQEVEGFKGPHAALHKAFKAIFANPLGSCNTQGHSFPIGTNPNTKLCHTIMHQHCTSNLATGSWQQLNWLPGRDSHS